ncbi:MAG: hypothetical protein IJM30_06425 [Thermoguttaceae bacterium]|nr:hypothetical protein [Thermoguttaceae bacterium]
MNFKVSRRRSVGLLLLATALLVSFPSCKTLNESPKNERFWFPTLMPPTQKEREMRAYNYPEGGDPYVDANVGPRSFNTRPRGWADQRSKTADVMGEYPDVNYD